MKPTAARSIIDSALGPLPGCPKQLEACRAGLYPHCASCDALERATARRVDELLAKHSATVGRARAEGVDLAEVTFTDVERAEVGQLVLLVHERCYKRVDSTALLALNLMVYSRAAADSFG